jgi:hypothetical protein
MIEDRVRLFSLVEFSNSVRQLAQCNVELGTRASDVEPGEPALRIT